MPSITSYPVPRNRFRLSRSSKRFISIRRFIADRMGIVEIAARKRDFNDENFFIIEDMIDNRDKISKIYFQLNCRYFFIVLDYKFFYLYKNI